MGGASTGHVRRERAGWAFPPGMRQAARSIRRGFVIRQKRVPASAPCGSTGAELPGPQVPYRGQKLPPAPPEECADPRR